MLILGAGASHPYGFPCGEKFREQILSVVGEGFHEHAINAFKEQFSGSDLASIDRFLDECQKRPERDPFPNKVIIEMGKAAIAHALLPCENPTSTVRDWYGSLVDALTKGYQEERATKLTILTFNYDRSLEFHLLRSLKAIDGGRKFDGAKVQKMVEIIHVYGQLGELPFWNNTEDVVIYGEETQISTAMKGIRVIGDRADDAHLKLIRSKIKEASALAFIGFGFLDENMELLQIPPQAEKPAFASTFRLGPGKKVTLKANYPNLNWVFGTYDSDAKDFLHQTDFFTALTSKSPGALATLAYQLP
ncbi:MAG: hypothetical protein ABL921_28880 [Pirellula sp.]